MNEIRVNYEQIKKANEEIVPINLKSKEYAPVNERIKAFRKVYPTGAIETEIVKETDDSITILATVSDEDDKIIATGRASERKTSNGINAYKMLENCETSAIGRALGIAGFGVDTAVASAEDVEDDDTIKTYEIAKGIRISMDEALKEARLTINELYKKMGMRKEDLNDFLDKTLWTSLADMNVRQLLRLEYELKTANMETSKYHQLYNQNTKAKDVTPKNQQVIYKSTYRRFGEIALNKCGTDELKRQAVIDEYAEMEIDLGVSYE